MKVKFNVIFYVGLLCILMTPFLFTRASFWKEFDFTQTGQIGDTIGGITAPFINLLGAILIYYSFKKQSEANLIQSEKNSFDLYNLEFIEIKKLYDDLSFQEDLNLLNTDAEEDKDLIQFFIRKAALEQLSLGINQYKEEYNIISISFEDDLEYLLITIRFYIQELESNKTISRDHKIYLLKKVVYFFLFKLSTELTQLDKDCEGIEVYNDLQDEIRVTVNLLDSISVRYKIEDLP